MSKYTEIAAMMERRIRNGDYAFARIPGARRLAEETGVSYMTARQAVQKLLDDGVIARGENGRLESRSATAMQKGPKVAFISPIRNQNYYLWEYAVKTAAEEVGGSFRMVIYSHNDDPIIGEIINGDFDLIFLSHAIDSSRFIFNTVRKNATRIVTMFHDFTAYGLRCFDGPPPTEAARLAEHLYRLGHRQVAGVMVSSPSVSSSQKLDAWNRAVAEYGMTSASYLVELKPFEYELQRAYRYFRQLLDTGEFQATAAFTPSSENAIAFIRACHDCGLAPGKDISVCSFGKPEMAAMHIPSITVINRPDPIGQAREIIRDFIGGDNRRLMYRPVVGEVIVGESTGPAPDVRRWLKPT